MSSDKKPSTTCQNVPAIIATRGNGTTIQGLLDNDHVSNAPNALINVTGVSNASHGSIGFNAATGNVTSAKQSTHYKNRSCLRMYLLGCSTKTYLKKSKTCSKQASTKAGSRKEAQKSVNLGSKSSQGRLFMGASSYEIKSALTSPVLT